MAYLYYKVYTILTLPSAVIKINKILVYNVHNNVIENVLTIDQQNLVWAITSIIGCSVEVIVWLQIFLVRTYKIFVRSLNMWTVYNYWTALNWTPSKI